MNAEEVKKDWESRGFSFGIWEDPPGQIWKNYVHEADELFMLVEGEVRVTIDGATIDIFVGEEVFIPEGSVHSVITSEKSQSIWYYGYRR